MNLWAGNHLRTNDDIVNWYVNQFNEESDESHYAEPNSSGHSNFLELSAVGLGASLDQSD